MARTTIVDAPAVVPRHGRMPRRHPLRRALSVIAIGLGVVLVAVVGVVGISVLQLRSDIDTVDLGGEAPPAFAQQQGAFNILLVGSDSRQGQTTVNDGHTGGALNDVTMLLHVSADHERATVISFPRDLMIDFPACPAPEDGGAEIPAANFQQLNTALGRGGLACVAEVVSELSGLDVPYAALIDFDGVVSMSTAVGGVPVCFAGPIDDPYTGLQIPEGGTFDLQAPQALEFLRSRHGGGDGSDLARISSQQVFLSSLVRKLQSDAVLTDLGRLYQIAQVATSSMTMSSSLNDVGTMASMARVLADIPLDTMQFIQYPSASNGTGRVIPTAVADEVMALIAADQPVNLDPNATGQGSEATPAPTTDPGVTDPTATDPTATDPTATDPMAPEPSAPATSSAPPGSTDPTATQTPFPTETPIEGVQGTNAAQETCVVPFAF